jgi:hypothetical protein
VILAKNSGVGNPASVYIHSGTTGESFNNQNVSDWGCAANLLLSIWRYFSILWFFSGSIKVLVILDVM